MQLNEQEIEHDEIIEKFFLRGTIPSDESNWDYVVTSYLLKGELVYQERSLSPELSREFEKDGFDETEGIIPGD